MSNTGNMFMQSAFEIANRVHSRNTSPNPRVGCVVVKDGTIIAEGAHEKFGGLHAERKAIQDIIDKGGTKSDLAQSEIYITLEPCDHFEGKKTPSCTDLLTDFNPQKVIIGSLDPQFQGKNVAKIRKSGIEVTVLNDGFHEQLNPFFEKHIITKKPYITLKVAQSLDGKIGKQESEKGKVLYITNEHSLARVHAMRTQHSAILTTTQTILADNPRMDIRLEGREVVGNPDIIIVGKSELSKDLKIFQIKNREIHRFETFEDFWTSDLSTRIDSVMTECGQGLNTYLLENNLVDEVNLFIAPKIWGAGNVTNFASEIDLSKFDLVGITNLDGDILMTFRK